MEARRHRDKLLLIVQATYRGVSAKFDFCVLQERTSVLVEGNMFNASPSL